MIGLRRGIGSRWSTALGAALIALVSIGPVLRAPAAAAPRRTGEWQVVLAAGASSEPVFDDATKTLGGWLVLQGVPEANIHRLSASRAEIGGAVEPSSKAALLRRIAALPARPGDRCLVFMTSHGVHGGGFYLEEGDDVLTPNELARALSRGCAAVPTVAIVSSCYSGGFAVGALDRPNHILMTAARVDRPSFGCAADRKYTFFDECLLGTLGTLPGSGTWREVYTGTNGCVRRLEQALHAVPSQPQAYFGAAVSKLPAQF